MQSYLPERPMRSVCDNTKKRETYSTKQVSLYLLFELTERRANTVEYGCTQQLSIPLIMRDQDHTTILAGLADEGGNAVF